jgi:hypothetical protein
MPFRRRGTFYRTAPEGEAAPAVSKMLESATAAERVRARALWRRIIGTDNIEFVDRLFAEGAERWGRWQDQWATIVEGQGHTLGTTLHEAVHAAMELFLTPQEAQQLRRSKMSAIDDTSRKAEEALANGFLAYVEARAKGKSVVAAVRKAEMGQAVRNLLEKLYQALVRLFHVNQMTGKTGMAEVEGFYENLLNGYYRKQGEALAAGQTATQGQQAEAYRAAQGDSLAEAQDLVTSMRYARGSDQAKAAAEAFLNKPLVNRDSGITATVSGGALGKMFSESSVPRSVSPQAHAQAVANLDKLFPMAIKSQQREDRESDPTIRAIHHFECPMPFDGEALMVKIMAKEYTYAKDGTRLYLVQAVEIEKPASNREAPTSSETTSATVPLAGFDGKIQALVDAVKAGIAEHGPQEPRYRTAAQAAATEQEAAVERTLAEHFDGARGWVGDFLEMRQKPDANARPDISKFDVLLRTIANYAKKVPALKLIFQAAQDFATNRHLYGERIFGAGEMLIGDLAEFAKKNAAAWKGKVQPYLWEQDLNAAGPRVEQEGDVWVIYSAANERLGQATSEEQVRADLETLPKMGTIRCHPCAT